MAAPFAVETPSTPCAGVMGNNGEVVGSDPAAFRAELGRTDCTDGPLCAGDLHKYGDVAQAT